MKPATEENPPLFFAESLGAETMTIMLSGEEAKHILLSRRLKIGQQIVLTNGKGVMARGNINAINSRLTSLSIAIDSSEMIEPPNVKLTLASAIPKGERQSIMLSMVTQLGMNEYIPLLCDYSVVKYEKKMHQRWHRLFVSACKQSRQYYIPVVREECGLTELLSRKNPHCALIMGDPGGETIVDIRSEIDIKTKEIILLVGPEGGFSERESTLMESRGVLKLRLSNQILRTETAAISMLGAVNQFNWIG